MEFRSVVRTKMAQELTELPDNTFTGKNLEKIANNLEKSIFNAAVKSLDPSNRRVTNPKFRKNYSRIFRKVLTNLFKNPCSDIVRERIKNGNIKVTDLATMTHQELDQRISAESKEMYDKQLFVGGMTEQKRKMVEETIGIFKCGKCRSEKTTYYELQLRSSDEPATAFITCLNCKNRWRR